MRDIITLFSIKRAWWLILPSEKLLSRETTGSCEGLIHWLRCQVFNSESASAVGFWTQRPLIQGESQAYPTGIGGDGESRLSEPATRNDRFRATFGPHCPLQMRARVYIKQLLPRVNATWAARVKITEKIQAEGSASPSLPVNFSFRCLRSFGRVV